MTTPTGDLTPITISVTFTFDPADYEEFGDNFESRDDFEAYAKQQMFEELTEWCLRDADSLFAAMTVTSPADALPRVEECG